MSASAVLSPMVKTERQHAILELVGGASRPDPGGDRDRASRRRGLEVTQATVSRDIRELGLVRVHDDRMGCATSPAAVPTEASPASTRLRAVMREHVRSMEFVEHIGVVRTRPSSAPLVAAVIDACPLRGGCRDRRRRRHRDGRGAHPSGRAPSRRPSARRDDRGRRPCLGRQADGRPRRVTVSQSKRCVLAYSGGLDTSVSIRWLQEKLGYEVITCTADIGEAKDIEEVTDRALRTGAVAAYAMDARHLFVEEFCFPTLAARRPVRGRLSAGHRPGPAADRQDAGRRRPRRGRRGRRPRLHRQGQRPGALRRRHRRPGPGAAGRGPGARLGDGPSPGDRIRAPSTASRSRSPRRSPTRWTPTSGAAASRPACSRTRGRRRAADVFAWTADPARLPEDGVEVDHRLRARRPRRPSTASGLRGDELVTRLNAVAGAHGCRPDRPRREPPGGHQVARDLRGPGGGQSARRAHRAGDAHAGPRRRPSQAQARRRVGAARLRRALVSASCAPPSPPSSP